MGISAEHSSKDAVFTGNGDVFKMSENSQKCYLTQDIGTSMTVHSYGGVLLEMIESTI